MLFKKELPINMINTHTHTSDDSRIILVNCELNDNTYTILNIYAPNSYQDRKSFFKKTQKWIIPFSLNDAEIIVGGDFNFAENPKLDRHKCHEKQTDTSSHSFNDLKTNFGLIDVWRYMHPNKNNLHIETYAELTCSLYQKNS